MIFKGFKEKSNRKYLDKLLSTRAQYVSDKPLKSLGVITYLKDFNYLNAFENLAKELHIRPNRLEIISFSLEEKNELNTWDKLFNPNDLGRKGTIKNIELERFLNTEFDALISFYESDILELKLLTALSKAQFKIGLFQSDERLNDLIIKTNAKDFDIFQAEVKKYLMILNKIEYDQ